MQRVMYAAFDVTIPAHGSVTVSASMHKEASCDYIGKKKNVDGYDLATQLGSTLALTEQRASVSNTEEIRIVDNNFGFDLDAGITQVTLDPEVEHYWMQVEKIREEKIKAARRYGGPLFIIVSFPPASSNAPPEDPASPA